MHLLDLLMISEDGYLEYSELIIVLGKEQAVAQVEMAREMGLVEVINPMIGESWMFPDQICAVVSLPGVFV